MAVLVRGYETQVKVFMLLVVLFLVTSNLVTVTFLNVSEGLLREEAGARVIAATVSMAREIGAEGIVAPVAAGEPGAGAAAGERLARFCASQGASYAEVVDGTGAVLASSQPWRIGLREPLEALLDAAQAGTLAAGRPVLIEGPDAGSLTTVIAPGGELPGGAGRAHVRAGYALGATGAITRQIRLLTWAQAVGGAVVLVMVLVFTRFVLRPYRELRAAAADVAPPPAPEAARDDPAFLVASFRGVVDKMRSLEAELERMKFGGSSPGSREGLLASLSSGVLILDAGGAVAALNPAGESILGLGAPEVAGRRFEELFAGSPELASVLEDAVRRGRGRSREVVPHRLPTGRTVHLGVTVSSPPGGGGGALCLFSDLTEIRGLQARVLLKENLARLGEMSAGIAHEFRNGLATILGYARLASKSEGPEGGNASSIIREVQAMGRLVDEFLRYAGPARLQRTEVDLRAIVEDVGREIVRGGEDVGVRVEGDWPERMTADEALLRQALHNLARNAVEAALSGEPPRTVRIAGRRDGGAAVVEIDDSGPGFRPDVLEKLFTPFVTTKDGGTGLGMALAQKIIVSHDGSIEAANLGGRGARVTITLPVG
jgi:PAS domain S-box-containing protein